MKRIFIPVGQGAFYTEKFGDFTMVYDCGTKKGKKFIQKVIEKNFVEGEVIDILFISHFHSDHINGIEYLKRHCKIKNVVLPFLHDNMKIALLLEAKFSDEEVSDENFISYLDRFLSFEEFFSGTNIYYLGGEEAEQFDSDIILNEFRNDPSKPISIKSGSRFTSSKTSKWVFVPYNRENATHKQEIEDAIKQSGKKLSDIEKRIYNANNTKEDLNEIRDLYTKIFKGKNEVINYNSMLVYSGPEAEDFKMCRMFQNYPIFYDFFLYEDFYIHRHGILDFKVGCIYTGDSNIEKGLLQKAYHEYENFVGTVQIPHHGSNENFDKSIFDFDFLTCPISFGTNNRYHHPGGLVVAELFWKHRKPVFITEDPNSMFIQTFEVINDQTV